MNAPKARRVRTRILMVLALDLFLTAFYFIYWFKPIFGITFLLVVAVNLLVYGLLSPFATQDKNIHIIGSKELSNSTRLLRYATAALAFVSLLTTANGMQSFVFAKDQGWLAYLASFAVQAILVIFSLLLCHFYTVIGQLKSITDTGKRLLLCALTTFFAAAFVVSSSFSYSYIAKNAYASSWNGDCETMIQTYLIREAGLLDKENDRIGGLLLDAIIGDVGSNLKPAVDAYNQTLNTGAANSIANFKLNNYTLKDISIADDIANLHIRFPSRTEDINNIQSSYQGSFEYPLMDCQKRYNDVVKSLQTLSSGSDLNAVQKLMEQADVELNGIIKEINNLLANIDGLKSFHFQLDLSTIRTKFKLAAESFKIFIEAQINNTLQPALSEVKQANAGLTNNLTGSVPILDQVEEIQRRIYLLEANQSTSSSTEIASITTMISDLLQDLAGKDILGAGDVRSLMSLSDQLKEYGKYLDLSNELETYLSTDLAKTYFFSGDGAVTAEAWRAERDGDYHQLFSMLKELPNPPSGEDWGGTQNGSEQYDAAATLDVASRMRRDLLGDVTEFERSVNYFKYDFTQMAIFSAFVAVFLDLGAFLTGCFLYGTRHLQKIVDWRGETSVVNEPENNCEEEEITEPNGEVRDETLGP